jgi:hypothetical protein
MENIDLVGMTAKDLQKAVGVYYNTTITQPNGSTSVANVTFLPADHNQQHDPGLYHQPRTRLTGYAAGQEPTGRFIAPAGFGNCQYRSLSEVCGFRKFVLYGPDMFQG